MKQYNLARLISETKSSLISYLASSLPVGNHSSQERLGEAFYTLWEERTFKGPFVESVPRYKQVESLGALIERNELGGERDRVVASRLRPTQRMENFGVGLPKLARASVARGQDGGGRGKANGSKIRLKSFGTF